MPIARQRQAIVFGKEPDGTYDIAMVDPSDLETITFLGQRLKAKIKPFLATAEDLKALSESSAVDIKGMLGIDKAPTILKLKKALESLFA